jgi:cytochrome P450
VAVIADLLGVPERTRPDLLRWANDAASTLDPALTWRQYRAALAGVRSLHAWFADHVQALRRDPGEDLLSQLALLEGEDALTDVELHATGLLVLGAGFETTVNLIGNAVHVLATHPDQREVLRADPDLWGNAVDEVLRYESPVQLTLRTAYRDLEIQGHAVPTGRPVLVMLGGANRDPAVFDDPHRFDVTRPNAGAHLAFSSGVHYCLGASLARREAEVGLRSLYERFPDLDAAGAPVRRGTRVLRGYERLPVATRSPVVG